MVLKRGLVLCLLLASGCASRTALTNRSGLPSNTPANLDPNGATSLDTNRYFQEGAALHAKRAFDRGDYAEARALLNAQDRRPEIRYLRALSALRAGDARTAGPEFLELGAEYQALADRCFFSAGAAFEAQGRLADAAGAYARVPTGTSYFSEARLALARTHLRAKAFDDALSALVPLKTTETSAGAHAEALWVEATIHRAKGDTQAEQAALLALWVEHPASSFATRAQARLPGALLSAEVSVRRAESLLSQRKHREALTVAQGTRTGSRDLSCRANAVVAEAQRRLGRKKQALAGFERVVQQCRGSDARAAALWALAQMKPAKESVGLYDRLAREHSGHALADDALLAAGYLMLELEDTAGALERWDRVGKNYAQGDVAPDALFAAFWWHRRSGNLDRALAALEQLDASERAPQSETHAKVQYWRARLLEETKDEGRAVEAFEAVAIAAPGSYYGLLAKHRLASRGQSAPLSADADRERQVAVLQNLTRDPHFAAGVELMKLGMPDATRELFRVDLEAQGPEARALLFRVLYDGGREKQVALLTAQSELGGTVTPETEPVWRLAFPDTFRDLVVKSARNGKVDPNLLHALVREESGFRPTIRSGAGAVGLTQLMPSTARHIAKEAGLKFSERALMRPANNLTLAALYLRSLLDQFGGNVVHATASYNAGPTAVRRWLKEHPSLEMDDWVEEIPFAETRNYVKRVLTSYAAYALLSASKPAVVASK